MLANHSAHTPIPASLSQNLSRHTFAKITFTQFLDEGKPSELLTPLSEILSYPQLLQVPDVNTAFVRVCEFAP